MVIAAKARIHRLLRRKVQETLKRTGMLVGAKNVLVGVSGGVDSGVLLHLLSELSPKLGLTLVAAHVHHGMRGDEADRDAEVAEKVARTHGVEFNVLRVRPGRGGFSAEHQLRELRLNALEKLARKVKANRIALAHHMDDQAETFFMRLMGGADLKGLAGIRYFRPPHWVRPLLDVTREEIVREARHCHIPYIEDSSNLATHSRRNFVRKNVFPVLRTQFNPQLTRHFAELASSFSTATDYFETQAAKVLRKATRHGGKMNILFLRDTPEVLRNATLQLAYRKLAGEGRVLRREQIRVINHLIDSEGKRRTYSLPHAVSIVRQGDWLKFS